jgi:predicted DNA-binding transcriptional regulator AlpA
MSKSTAGRTARKARVYEKRYISVPELAVRWDVSTSAIYHGKCGLEVLRTIRIGRSVRFLRTDIEAFEKAHEKH